MAYFYKLTNDNIIIKSRVNGYWNDPYRFYTNMLDDRNLCIDKSKEAKFYACIFEPISVWKAQKHPHYIENSLLF